MRLAERIRNLLETHQSVQALCDIACRPNPIYSAIVGSSVRHRQRELADTRNYHFMIETVSICNAKCSFCPNASMNRPH